MAMILGALAICLLVAGLSWLVMYVALDVFLRRVVPPAPTEAAPRAAARLWAAGRWYRLAGTGAALLAALGQGWLLCRSTGRLPLLLWAGLLLLDLAPRSLLWRTTLGKQFPHLREHL